MRPSIGSLAADEVSATIEARACTPSPSHLNAISVMRHRCEPPHSGGRIFERDHQTSVLNRTHRPGSLTRGQLTIPTPAGRDGFAFAESPGDVASSMPPGLVPCSRTIFTSLFGQNGLTVSIATPMGVDALILGSSSPCRRLVVAGRMWARIAAVIVAMLPYSEHRVPGCLPDLSTIIIALESPHWRSWHAER